MKGKRRGNREGSIGKRRDGRWWGRYTVQSPEGPKRKAVYGKTRAEAADKLARAMADRGTGPAFKVTEITFGEYLDRWLKNSAAPRVKPGTLIRYEGIVRNHLKPGLGGVKLSELTAMHLQDLYFERLGSLASGTVIQIHAVASGALKQARKWGLIPTNPAEDATPPRLVRAKESKTLSREEVLRFLEAVKNWRGDRYALFLLAVTTGARQGEILALRWKDLDLEKGEVRISESVDTWSGPPKFGSTKSGKRRNVKLAAAAVEALKDHRKSQLEARMSAEEWKDASLVFTGPTGDVIRRSVLYQSFTRLLKREGFPPLTFHELRHSAASLLLEDGAPAKAIQELLGHSSIRVTMDIYGHLSERIRDETAYRMDDLLSMEEFKESAPPNRRSIPPKIP